MAVLIFGAGLGLERERESVWGDTWRFERESRGFVSCGTPPVRNVELVLSGSKKVDGG